MRRFFPIQYKWFPPIIFPRDLIFSQENQKRKRKPKYIYKGGIKK